MYGIFTYIYHKNQLNVGKYCIPYMDPMGYDKPMESAHHIPMISIKQTKGCFLSPQPFDTLEVIRATGIPIRSMRLVYLHTFTIQFMVNRR